MVGIKNGKRYSFKPLNDNDFFIDIVDAMSRCKLKEKAYSLYQETLRGGAEQVDRISLPTVVNS
ncbi:hypothetical protein [Candidatus Uabimicrobium sp. HlEnr_7]|uniref:hypothetical protein n=1 Tax=Candidatus Uabimicrobium helgolandensis TaxID=3095367 RepID=UPI00355929C6